ncbi:hypothetical protein BH09ACT8_BH09ACT8_50710 [soil metagenome]|jgi:hypothetical protein
MAHSVDGDGTSARSRSGSETRRRDALLQLRMARGDREALAEHARRLGFKNAQDLVWSRLEADLVEARQIAS